VFGGGKLRVAISLRVWGREIATRNFPPREIATRNFPPFWIFGDNISMHLIMPFLHTMLTIIAPCGRFVGDTECDTSCPLSDSECAPCTYRCAPRHHIFHSQVSLCAPRPIVEPLDLAPPHLPARLQRVSAHAKTTTNRPMMGVLPPPSPLAR